MYPGRTSSGTLRSPESRRKTENDLCSPGAGGNGSSMGGNLSRGLGIDREDFSGFFRTIPPRKGEGSDRGQKEEAAMMLRFCRYVEKVFDFGRRVKAIRDSRQKPRIPTAAIWLSAFLMFAIRRGSLNAIESELHQSRRWEGLIGSHQPSADRIGDVFCLIPPEPLRVMLSGINHQLGRNKVFVKEGPLRFAALDGHEFFSQSASVLSSVFSAKDQDPWPRNHRILSSGSGLSFGRV